MLDTAVVNDESKSKIAPRPEKEADGERILSRPFDDGSETELVKRAKKQIRQRMKALRGAHSPKTLEAHSAQLTQTLLGLGQLQAATGVALYWPMVERGEVDTRGVDAELRRQRKRLYYPFMRPSPSGTLTTGFALTHSSDELKERGRGFMEPEPHTIARRGDVDFVVVPALAADLSGQRIGYGAGYYDATLSDICPPAASCIVLYNFQLLAELPQQAHDVPCDFVVTERAVHATRGPVGQLR